MYLKWQGQFWRACCSSASSASDGAAARTLCWWLLGAGLRCCSPTAQQADVGDALADPTGRETTPCCIPHSAGENGRRGCSDGRRRLEARPSSCALKKCLSGALWRKSSISVPFPCYLLLWQLQAGSGCSYSRVRFYLLLWACFCEDLPLRHDCNPVLFMPLQLLQAISFTFPRRV